MLLRLIPCGKRFLHAANYSFATKKKKKKKGNTYLDFRTSEMTCRYLSFPSHSFK